MKTVKGAYGEALIYTDLVDDKSIDQVKLLMDQPFVKGQQVRMMPDIHAGAGCTIGTTMTINDKVCPNLVGVDIGCGMLAAHIGKVDVDFDKFDKAVRALIPSGMNIRSWVSPDMFKYMEMLRIDTSLWCSGSIDVDRAELSMGTLGGGNHFIELNRAQSNDVVWMVIHTGSRHLGLEVANYYQKLAIKELKGCKWSSSAVIEELKRQGRQREIQATLQKMKAEACNIPDALCYLEHESFQHYMHDIEIVQNYAEFNRDCIMYTLCAAMGWKPRFSFHTKHNYVSMRRRMLRKGAVSAEWGDMLVIPMNMRDGSLLCEGKGNPDWNYSAPHGAGRVMSRAQARNNIDLGDYARTMENAGIWTSSVNLGTLDEAPQAYKPMESIVENIQDTVKVLDILKPIYNFKASE